jgi:hypothetical protein
LYFVCTSPIFTVIIPSKQSAEGSLTELPFGTGRRLFW